MKRAIVSNYNYTRYEGKGGPKNRGYFAERTSTPDWRKTWDMEDAWCDWVETELIPPLNAGQQLGGRKLC